ncbi:hypothetical protein CIP107570_02268 [Corynebacterium diphtheriae]|nr:hypothetical protein CIP107570_02268 [Corynebacterium diphtheriae]
MVHSILQFPPAARKVIYTTNSIESFNNELRKDICNRVQFTNDESALNTLWLLICNIEDKRLAKRAKEGRRVAASAGRLVEGGKVSGWKQAILTWLILVRRLGQLFGEFTDVSGQVGLCMEGLACDFDGKRPVFLQGSHQSLQR